MKGEAMCGHAWRIWSLKLKLGIALLILILSIGYFILK